MNTSIEKNAIVTGARKGIGYATVLKLAEAGYNIWACTRTYDDTFEEQLSLVAEKYHVWIKPCYFDLSDENQIKEGIKSIISERQRIDVLVNIAGMVFNGSFAMTPVAKIRDVFSVNYFNQIYIMQLVSRVMIRQRAGVVVNAASVSGIEITEGKLAYGSSKAAFIYATKAIAKELAEYNIRVNAIAPGLTDTDMNKSLSEESIASVLSRSSMKRMAQPEEIANAIEFLASEKSSFMTGQVLIVDGGRLWS